MASGWPSIIPTTIRRPPTSGTQPPASRCQSANLPMWPRANFDQQVFGTIWQYQKTGWSNDSSFVVEVQHRYSKGYAFQVFYTMSNAMRAGSDGWRDDILRAPNVFLPGAVPADQDARNRRLDYRRDTE